MSSLLHVDSGMCLDVLKVDDIIPCRRSVVIAKSSECGSVCVWVWVWVCVCVCGWGWVYVWCVCVCGCGCHMRVHGCRYREAASYVHV